VFLDEAITDPVAFEHGGARKAGNAADIEALDVIELKSTSI
jgi:hypothetical protein